jgi:transcriptional/translational regulatory protein YebC/TACO1
MTKDVIERAIGRGEPRTLASSLSPVTYEVMLPGGIAVIMYNSREFTEPSEAMTDNKARTATMIKGIIKPMGGTLSKVLYLFQRKGIVSIKNNRKCFDEILEEIMEVDVEDASEEEAGIVKVVI